MGDVLVPLVALPGSSGRAPPLTAQTDSAAFVPLAHTVFCIQVKRNSICTSTQGAIQTTKEVFCREGNVAQALHISTLHKAKEKKGAEQQEVCKSVGGCKVRDECAE
ncbi:hypothetical protein BCV69DRAFT_62326 [Microstroma glucosiphilum]|uniref:Uncharacterized protein n=1 Tax=Pseudomicrostroma glucosiphilum TaxID=1684307 RepID=A0A316U750_9BASI|nr:hypothetical protein BCV69DRAFT_62326 [Pseudomicrostroma glucosiphilum]PWN18765.1 hypothetical protein BCV69DRAFT_62326 [Pseudomicrostroma glucosiphilum]